MCQSLEKLYKYRAKLKLNNSMQGIKFLTFKVRFGWIIKQIGYETTRDKL